MKTTILISHRALLLVVLAFLFASEVVQAVVPSLRVEYPSDKLTVTNSSLQVSGVTTSTAPIAVIWIAVTNQVTTNPAYVSFPGTSSRWTNQVELIPGDNYLFIKSSDTNGHFSAAVKRHLFYEVKRQLSLEILGNGSVFGRTNGEWLTVGRTYALTARPATNHLFCKWIRDSVESNFAPNLKFKMEMNTSIQASFISNYFPTIKGDYHTVFYLDDNRYLEGIEDTGKIDVTIGNNGLFSGKATFFGDFGRANQYRFSGRFRWDDETNAVATVFFRRNETQCSIRFSVDRTTRKLECKMNQNVPGGIIDADPHVLERVVNAYATQADPSLQAGRYNFLVDFTAIELHFDLEVECGFGTAFVRTNGSVLFKCSMPGSRGVINTVAWMDNQRELPIFLLFNLREPYRRWDGLRSLVGKLTFSNSDPAPLRSIWLQIDPSAWNCELNGAPYDPEKLAALDFSSGTIGFVNASDSIGFHGATRSFDLPSENLSMQIQLDPISGWASGRYLLNPTYNPGAKWVPFKCGFVPQLKRAGGFSLAPNILGVTEMNITWP